MPTTTNLGLAVSSNPNDSVLDYWNKMLNPENGNFFLIDQEFGVLKTSISFTIPSASWVSDDQGVFKFRAEVTLTNTLVKDNSTIEAYFNDILNSAGTVLVSATQNGTSLDLVFYANEAKSVDISGVLKYVY